MNSNSKKNLLIAIPLILLLAIGAEVIFQLRPKSREVATPEQTVIENPTDSQKPEQDVKFDEAIVVPSVEPTYDLKKAKSPNSITRT